MFAPGQNTGTVLVKSRLLDPETKDKVLSVSRGENLEITGEKVKGYYPVKYDGEDYLIFHEYFRVEKPQPIKAENTNIKSGVDELSDFDQTKINQSVIYTNYCLNNFRKEQLWGIGISIAGGGLAAIGASNSSDELIVIGGIASLSGLILGVHSYRWLRRAYIYPIENGAAVGVKIKF
jgi:hypothetical protein